MNPLRHAMRARATVLLDENERRFQQLCDELQAEWQPPSEMALFEKIAIAHWKLVRAERREAITCDLYIGQNQETMLEPISGRPRAPQGLIL
jgi:hypothetical protein